MIQQQQQTHGLPLEEAGKSFELAVRKDAAKVILVR